MNASWYWCIPYRWRKKLIIHLVTSHILMYPICYIDVSHWYSLVLMNQTYYSLGDMPVRDGPSMSSYHVCRAVPGQGYVLTCSNISSWEWRKPPGEIRIKNQEVSASWKLLLPCVVIDLRIAFVAIRTPKLIQVINYVIRKIDVCSVCVCFLWFTIHVLFPLWDTWVWIVILS